LSACAEADDTKALVAAPQPIDVSLLCLLQSSYDAFMRTNPSLEMFEVELKKYMAIETEVAAIPALHNIGALSLTTQPLKASLKSEASSWKAQFAQNLHKQCAEDLRTFDSYIR
jgi:dynein heavy chain